MDSHILSKSSYMRGLKCHKSLFLNRYAIEERDDISEAQQYIFDQGKSVGLLAQTLFPNGIDLTSSDFTDYSDAIIKTAQLVGAKEKVIYEAAFIFEDVLSVIDILVYNGNGYSAFEVKSSTSLSDTHISDASLQYYVISKNVKLQDFSIIYVNNQYIRQGELNSREFFKIESIHEQVKEKQSDIPENVKLFKAILELKYPPNVDIGVQCFNPYRCDFIGHCWAHIPENSIFDIAGLPLDKKFTLYKNGVINFLQINEEIKNKFLDNKQVIQVESELSGEKIIDKNSISKFLSDLKYPLYFLDFETMMPAIPIYDNQRPYQQIPFQYSLHLIENDGESERHFGFLANPIDGDPRKKLAEKLISDCSTNGDILTYNVSFEKARLNELIRDFPVYSSQLQLIIERLKDLMIPFKEYWYYSPGMKGSYSIKSVLPELTPELSYRNFEIRDGGTASALYSQMAMGIFRGDIEKTKANLLNYCRFDTFAMVKILDKLKLTIT